MSYIGRALPTPHLNIGGAAAPPPPPRMSGIGAATVTCVLPDEDLKDRAPLRVSALL